LDTYSRGVVSRISPEAPTVIFNTRGDDLKPGEVGNVAINLASLGATVFLSARVGVDSTAVSLKEGLSEYEVNLSCLLELPKYSTPIKNRLIVGAHQVIRIDHESGDQIEREDEARVMEGVVAILDEVDVIAVSDYGKGFVTKRILSWLIEEARKRGIEIIVDPKGSDFTKYSGATLLKPNLTEAYRGASLDPSEASLDQVAKKLLAETDVEQLLITRSESGCSLFSQGGGRVDFPVRSKEVVDVTGAGDTVLTMIALCYANQIDLTQAIELALIGASISIEKVGCAILSFEELSKRMLEEHVENKIFDESHLFALERVLLEKKFSVIVIDQMTLFPLKIYEFMRELKAEGKVIIYLNQSGLDLHPSSLIFASFLASLSEVDFIVLCSESIRSLCNRISPRALFIFDGDEMKKISSLEYLTTSC